MLDFILSLHTKLYANMLKIDNWEILDNDNDNNIDIDTIPRRIMLWLYFHMSEQVGQWCVLDCIIFICYCYIFANELWTTQSLIEMVVILWIYSLLDCILFLFIFSVSLVFMHFGSIFEIAIWTEGPMVVHSL